MSADVLPLSLMALWTRNKRDCRPVGSIIADARAERLPGIRTSGYSFEVIDETTALKAMSRGRV